MKKRVALILASLTLSFVFGLSLLAQETTELSIQVKKDGKVLKDTTYQFEDEAEAAHAMKMMELVSGFDEDMEKIHYNYTTSGGKHANTMVFISEDGEKTEIKEIHGDSLEWIEEDEHAHGEHVIVMKSGDGETFDILIDEDGDHEVVKKKEIKVIISDDEEGSWTVDSKELKEIDEDENVKVIVIKKQKDCDEDHDHDHDEDVEVEVIKKVKKEKN